MANTKRNAKAQNSIPEKLKVKASLHYFGYGAGKFGDDEKTQLSIIPEEAEALRDTLSACYIASGTDEKWLPDFVAKDKDRINLSSKFDVPVLVADGKGGSIETTVREFIHLYGTPVKGTKVTCIIKFKNGSLYPVALKFEDALPDIETYSLDSLFD